MTVLYRAPAHKRWILPLPCWLIGHRWIRKVGLIDGESPYPVPHRVCGWCKRMQREIRPGIYDN